MIFGPNLDNYSFKNGDSAIGDNKMRQSDLGKWAREHDSEPFKIDDGMKHLEIRIYRSHIGIVDDRGCTLASISGGISDQSLETATKIVCGYNYFIDHLAKND